MAKKIKPVDLSAAVREILDEYGEEVNEILTDCVDDVAREATQKLQNLTKKKKEETYWKIWLSYL